MKIERRRKLVIDTNIVISGLLAYGLPYTLLQLFLQDAFELVTTKQILAEWEEVLQREAIKRNLKKDPEFLHRVITRLRQASKRVTPFDTIPIMSRDPKDDKFLCCAFAAEADYIVTGDSDLLVLQGDPALGAIQIVTVREYLVCLSSEKGTRLPTKKGATEIFLSTSRESSKSSKKREPGVSAVLIEKEATRAC